MVQLFYLWAITALTQTSVESSLHSKSGLIERRFDAKDSRIFEVNLTRADGSKEVLEGLPIRLFSSDEKIYRKAYSATHDAIYSESFGETTIAGYSRRVFHNSSQPAQKFCDAIAHIYFPTPISEQTSLLISNLNCKDDLPLTETKRYRVKGRDDQSWVSCDGETIPCIWNYNHQTQSEAAVQTSVLGFIWTAYEELKYHSLEPSIRGLTLKSWASRSDRSSYDARSRGVYYGAGNYLDGLDGFIVVHEWAHALTDDLNPGLYGYESEVIHEAISDFVAAQVFNDPCFAPYDVKEHSNARCERDLKNQKKLPQDFKGESPHDDSLILSGALWETHEVLEPGLVFELTLETLIRIDKDPRLTDFWKKFLQVYDRLLLERKDLKDQRQKLNEIGHRRGL